MSNHRHNQKTMLGERNLSTTDVCKLLGFYMSVDQLKSCGVSPFVETAQGVYWRGKDVVLIAHALSRKFQALARELE